MADYEQVMKNYYETPGFLQELMDNAGRPIPNDCYDLLDDTDFEQDWLDIKFDKSTKNSFLFYVENPPVPQVGYYENKKIFAIKADPYVEKYAKTEEDKMLYNQADQFNEIDGDTIKFNLDTIIDDNTAFELAGKTYNSFSAFAKDYSASSLRMRLLGINAPELVHYAAVPIREELVDKSTVTKKFKDIKNNDNYILEDYVRENEEEIRFFISDTSFYEIIEQQPYNEDNLTDIIKYTVVIANDTQNKSEEYIQEGLKAKELLIDLFDKATDTMIIVDHKALSRKPSLLPQQYNYEAIYNEDNTLKKGIAYLQKRWEELFSQTRYRYMGFNAPGIEKNGRFLGAVYVKVPEANLGSDYKGSSKEVWVNVAKYILYNCREYTEALPNYTNNPKEEYHNTFVSDSFKLYSYDIDGIEIIDKFNEYTDQFIIERNNLYKELTGLDVSKLKDFTFILGDCILMVPPVSIKSTTQTAHEKIPLLRARGSAVKSSPKSLKLIEVELYFNEDNGINGTPMICPLNNTGKNTVYYMNGLRSIISMFKLTPFLPIENNYVNNVLGIDAVTLYNIQISTVPNYPKTLRAILTLQEFNYQIYMPELECSANDVNPFSRTIHYPAMRWYYQQPIQKGNEIKDYEFNSDEYIKETYGSRIALVPMSFDNPSLEFYVPDEAQLQRRLEAVISAYPVVTQQQLTADIKQGMKECLPILDQIQTTLDDEKIINCFDNMMKKDVLTFGSQVYCSNLEYVQADMSNTATIFPVVLAEDVNKPTTVWPQSNNARWQKVILQYDYVSEGLEEGSLAIPNFITLPYPHENYSKDMMNELCKNFSYHFSVYGDVEIQEVISAKNDIDKTYTIRMLVPLPEKLRSSTYETNLLLRKLVTDLKSGEDYLFYNSQGVLSVPIDFSMDIERFRNKEGDLSDYGYRPVSNMTFDYNSNGFYFLNYIKKMVENVDPESVGDESSRLQAELYNEINDTILNQDLGLKFNKYDLGDVVIESFAFSYSNTFSRMHLKAMDGYGFQYCGGQDMAIEINIVTQDEMAVAMLVDLPKFSAYYARHYRLVLNCWPLRINSEFTRLFGINEVIVENVITQTVENQPGVTRVTVKLFSVDRTTRSREALKKIDVDNTLGSNAIGEQGKKNIRDMFYLKDALSKAELYPDLQLPTITEIEEAGFKLYKHAQIEEYVPQRTFVDPDFYFVYGQILACDIYKKSVMDALKKVDTISYEESDIYGALSTIFTPEIIDGKKEADVSDETIKADAKYFQDEDKTIYQTHKLENDVAYAESKSFSLQVEGQFDYVTIQKEVNSNISDLYKLKFILPETIAQLNTPFWDISKEVKIAFREKQFEVLANVDETVVGQTMKDLKQKKIEIIDHFIQFSPWKALTQINIKPELNKDSFTSYEKLTKYTESRVKDILDIFFKSNIFADVFEVLSIYNGPNSDSIEDIKAVMYNTILAAADAYTGEMYYNSSFYSDAVNEESSAKASAYNWKAKAFLSFGEAIIEDSNGSIRNSVIPYCRAKRQNGVNVFATNVDDALENGYAFGIFQIKKYPKSFVEKITGEDSHLEEGKEYFLNNELRQFQLYSKDALHQDLEAILLDPGFAAIAYLQEILTLYKYYLENDTLLSVYEIARLQANMQQNKIENNEVLKSYNTYNYSPDDTLETIQKEIFSQFYELVSIVATLQGYDTEKREYLCTTVLKLKADEEELRKAIKKTVSGPEEKLQKFIDNAKEKSVDSTLSEEERNRWTALHYAATTKPDIVSLSYQVRQLLAAYNAKVAINNEAFNGVIKMIKEDELKMVAGRISAMTMLLMDYNNLADAFDNKNINELNRIVSTAATPSINSEYALYRKYIYALMGRKIIDTASTNFPVQTADSILRNVINEYVNVWKSNSPKHYMKDSYFDMIKNDKRGRMVRAFPTYYLLFIDEGRDIGLWHLHDNFYGMNAIAEIEVTKSRKIAADTAHIVMTNVFKNYLTNDQDTIYNMDYKSLNEIIYTIKDVYESIFSPRAYAEKEEKQRQNTLQDLNASITSGARIHLRMGYGANAANLPVVFNGTVAEINSGEIVEIVAQGDGIELNNPLEEDNVEDIKNQEDFAVTRVFEDWWNNGVTPKTLLSSLMITKGKWLTNTIREITKGRFFNTNPYGIVHFGDPDYTEIFSNSECTQNVFEAYNEAIYVSGNDTRGLEPKYKTADIPKIAVHANGKTFWDLMHISASTCPDYICSIVPFDMRSSVFLGAGRYYAAYTYIREINNVSGAKYVKEKRKPFQQYHFYSSYTDIIENHITTSSKDVKTNAIGYYSETRWFGNEATQKVGPLYIDYDIYPEYQKSMTVDTQLWAKGLPIVGNMFGVISDLNKDVGDNLPGAKEIAWRMTAHALKDSVKDMYQGEIIVLGDPCVKPYDRMYIQDIYESMQGECEIEAVVHSFNANSGFTSSIYADCISAVDDRYERYNQMISRSVAYIASSILTPVVIANILASRFGFISKNISKKIMTGGSVITKHLVNICKLIDKDPSKILTASMKGTSTLANAIMPNGSDAYYDVIVDSYNKLGKKLVGLDETESIDDFIKFLSTNGKVLKEADPDDLYDTFKVLSANTSLSADELLELKKELSVFNSELKTATQQTLGFGDEFFNSLSNVRDKLRAATATSQTSENAIEMVEGLKEFVVNLDRMVDTRVINSGDDLIQLAGALKTSQDLIKDADALKDVARAAKAIKNLDTIADTAKTFKTLVPKLKSVVSGALALAGPAGWAVAAVRFIIETTVSFLIGAYACEAVERYLQNLQMLQIYPLTKNGYVMTAGIVGHKGLVVGSPTENIQGVWTNYVADIFGAAPPNDLVSGIAQLFFTNDRTRKIAANLKNKNGLVDPLSSNFDVQKAMSNLNNEMAKTYAKYALKNEKYLFKIDRCKTEQEIAEVLPFYYIKSDDTGIITAKTGEELVPIQEDKIISQMIDKRIVMLFNNINNQTQVSGIFGGKTVQLMCDKKDDLYNVPILRPEANIILRDICTVYCTEMGYDDKMEEDMLDNILDNSLIINSATIINDESYDGTGFCFKINMLNNTEDSVLPNVMKAIDNTYNVDKNFPVIFIECDQNTKEYTVCVNPVPKKED